jgi:hypothetical protein
MRHNLTPEQIGIDYDALAQILALSKQKAQILSHFDPAELIEGLIQKLGLEKVQELVDRYSKPPASPAPSAPADDK